MTDPELQLSFLGDPRFAPHALGPAPVWLWSADADRILWTNPAGASIFDAATPAAIALRRFDSCHAAAAQVARLAGALPPGGAPRLERLRGFGANIGGVLICLCSRITLADGTAAVLVVSTDRAGRDLALPERGRRLLEDLAHPAAIFTADGELIVAKAAAHERLGDKRDLVALGAQNLARLASLNGVSEGEIPSGSVRMLKLGAGPTFALLMTFATSTTKPGAAASAAAAANPTETKTPKHVPFRFVWRTDAGGRFTLASDEFITLVGPKTADVLNNGWAEIAAALKLDPAGQIANALAARETFSGIPVLWPVDGTSEHLAIEMSGLPVFNRERQFEGFRGFGICRDANRLDGIRRQRAHAVSPPSASKEPAAKVLPFRSAAPTPTAGPALSGRERSAFQELARELHERLKKPSAKSDAVAPPELNAEPLLPVAPPAREPPKAARDARDHDAQESRPILDRLPVGILVYRLNSLIYANRAFLDWTGYTTLEALTEAGGLDCLFIETKAEPSSKAIKNGVKSLTIATVKGNQKPVTGNLFSVVWNDENALVLMINPQAASDASAKTAKAPQDRVYEENRELKAILDTATDGVLVLDHTGHILSANRSAEALFGYAAADFAELSLSDLLAAESRHSVFDHLDRLGRNGRASVLNAGYEAIGRVRQGGLVPLHITMGRIEDGEKLCAVLRDITAWKRSEEELVNAKQEAERASTAKSEFLAKISHEIRTPLNAIIGFSEVMMDERFGPVGNERYRQYLKDIHASGGHLISLLNDLLDLSKIEAGKLELTFVSVNLNDLIQQCVAIMQEQANRERVIIRTSLPASLPQIVADARSIRQIALNLLSNSIKFTGAGGQVIVSTALTDDQEVVLRVRDTGSGMSEKEVQTALEPFRQVATAVQWGASGTGLGLPITKALAEANHAHLRITSQVHDGTLIEVAFPATRVLAQ